MKAQPVQALVATVGEVRMKDEELIGYLLDAYEVAEQEQIEAQLVKQPQLQARLEQLRQQLQPLACDDVITPPAHLGRRTLEIIRYSTSYAQLQNDWSESPVRMRPIDFLVTVAVLSIVALLIFPALATLRGDQARVLCAERLRHLGVALATYANQHNNSLPYVSLHGPLNNAGVFAMSLKDAGIVENEKAFICPSANSSMVMTPEVEEYLNYLQESPQRAERIRRFMSGSYGYTLGYAKDRRHHGFDYRQEAQPILSDRPPRAEEVEFFNSPNHNGTGQNVLFKAGNVSWLVDRVFAGDDIFCNQRSYVGAGVHPQDVVIGVSEATPVPVLAGL